MSLASTRETALEKSKSSRSTKHSLGGRCRAVMVLVACLGLGCASLLSLDYFFPPNVSRVNDLSREVVDRHGQLLRVYLAGDDRWRMRTSVGDIPQHYLDALLAFEDRRFRYHPGVDPFALARAIVQAITHGRVISGASTITMQTARLLARRPRTLKSKLTEMLCALQLEWRYSKEEILGFYLTLAPFGGNIEGVRAASWAWFGKPARRLTPAESALLVALPQAPERLRPDRFAKTAQIARNKVLRRMADHGVLSEAASAQLRQAPFPARRHAMASLAPHFSNRVVGQRPEVRRHSTTLEHDVQVSVRDLLRLTLSTRDSYHSGAVLVVDLKTREIRAYVASPDAMDSARLGAIDMVNAVRSPGSALKPFIYGAAFEKGWLHPLTIVADRARRFGSYVPGNFSRSHVGEATVAQALQWSLNVPAVAVLERLGPRRFVERLRQAGVSLHFPPDARPGLSVALGGVGMTLESLTMLYAVLGAHSHLHDALIGATDGPNHSVTAPLFGERATRYVGDILRHTPRPGNEQSLGHIAFKTGTSYGHRDAWALGFGDHYAVGVWTGRVDGTPVAGSTGIAMAAPLLFSVFASLEPHSRFKTKSLSAPLRLDATQALPRGLRYLDSKSRNAVHGQITTPLAIVFPPDGALLELCRQRARCLPLNLAALGGRGPLTWVVNGEPLSHGFLNAMQPQWQPDGLGFVKVRVRDRDGDTEDVTVQIH